MRVLVTGGAGFVGSHVVERLVREGHAVAVLDNLSTGSLDNLASVIGDVDWREGDLRDRAAVERAAAGAEAVVHLAALASVPRSLEHPREVAEVNAGGTLTALLAARAAGARRFVFASSSSVYGDAAELPKRETSPPSPRSPYAATKVAGEAYVAAFAASGGLDGVALRFFNVYGPRQAADSPYAAVVPRFVAAALEGRPPTVFGDGRQTRDFTYVDDVVDAVLRAAAAPGPLEGPVNVGAGRRTSVLELAAAVARAAGVHLPPRHEPPRAGDVRDSVADVARARERLGWRPTTSLDDGVARTVAAARARAGAPSRASS